MFKGLGQITSLLKNAHEMQGRMKEMQESLRRLTVVGTAGGDMVSIEMNGAQQVVGCHIDAALFAGGDREMLEDLIIAATNQALEKIKQAAAAEMEKLAGGIDMSGFGEVLTQMGAGGPGGRA